MRSIKPTEREKMMMTVIQDERTCRYCKKTYKSPAHLDKHVYLCRLMTEIETEKITAREDVPSQHTMYIMLLELGHKYKQLEEKYDNLNKLCVKKKKKINVVDWLNVHMRNSMGANYTSYFDDHFIVSMEDVETYLFTHKYADFFNLIIQRMNFDDAPIIACSDRKNIIYAFMGETWCEMTKEQISTLLVRCKKMVFAPAFELKGANREAIEKSDKLEEKFDRLMLKIIHVEMSNTTTYNRLRGHLYNALKKEIDI